MKKQKKVKLEVGEIWQVPKMLEIRTITKFYYDLGMRNNLSSVDYVNIGGCSRWISYRAFRRWITRKKAKLIGHYDFKTKKAVPVK